MISKKPPQRLSYKGREYRLALTEEARVWKKEITPRVERLLELCENEDISDVSKREHAARLWEELREFMRYVGVIH